MPVASRETQHLPLTLRTSNFLCDQLGNSHLCPFLNLQWLPPGLPDDLIQKGKDIKGVSEVVQDGKHFKLTITTGSKVIKNEFTLGEECELETMTGEKVKVGDAPPATLCFWNFPRSLVPGLPPSRVTPHNSHHGCPVSELTSGVRNRETKSALGEEALRENFLKD